MTLGNDVSHRHCKPKQAYSLGYTWDGGDSQAGTRGLGLQVTVSPLARVRPMLRFWTTSRKVSVRAASLVGLC